MRSGTSLAPTLWPRLAGFAPTGFCLTLIRRIGIPVTNTSVNPARSAGPAVIVDGWALAQLWLFLVAPIVGGVLGGFVYRWLGAESTTKIVGSASKGARAQRDQVIWFVGFWPNAA